MKGRGNTSRKLAAKHATECRLEKKEMEKAQEEEAAAPSTSKHTSRKPRKASKTRVTPTEEMEKAFAPDKRKPTPAWDALSDSVKREFIQHVLESLQEPWDPQAIFDAMNAVLFDGKLPYVDVKYDFVYFEGHLTWGATTSIVKATGEVLRIRVNPRLGEPGSRLTLVVAIVHESLHVAVARDGKFNAIVAHGLDFGLYSALASEKTGLVIPAAWDEAEIDLTLIDLPAGCKEFTPADWCAHWKAAAEALEGAKKKEDEGTVELAFGKEPTKIKARCRVRYEGKADKGVRERRKSKDKPPTDSEDEVVKGVRELRVKSRSRSKKH